MLIEVVSGGLWSYLVCRKTCALSKALHNTLSSVLKLSCRRHRVRIVLHGDQTFEAIVTSWLQIAETVGEQATSRFLGPWRHTRLTSSCSSDVIRHHSPFHSPLQCPPTPWFLPVPLLTKFPAWKHEMDSPYSALHHSYCSGTVLVYKIKYIRRELFRFEAVCGSAACGATEHG